MLYGPNTNLGHNSIIFMIECQVGYARAVHRRSCRERGARVARRAPRRDGRATTQRLQRELAKTAWAAGCTSWYKTASGKVTNNWSGFTVDYWRRTRHPNWHDYRFVRA